MSSGARIGTLWSALVLGGCATAPVAPVGPVAAPAPASAPADPWLVPSGAGVTQGEPDARFVIPAPSRPPPRDDAARDGSLGSLRDGPTGSPPEARNDADAVAARLLGVRASMRRCYDKALAADPSMRAPGAARVDFGLDGKPARVTFGGKPPRPGVETCLAEVWLRDVEGGSTIVIPITKGDM